MIVKDIKYNLRTELAIERRFAKYVFNLKHAFNLKISLVWVLVSIN